MLPKVIVILGQTATGKSDLAVKIAKKVKGEIISADSRQVYTGLDIGTGKITKKEMRGVPHHLLDVVKPNRRFTVAEYQKATNSAIAEIVAKNKVPILCGGTGFYIDAITKGTIFPEVSPNIKLRKILEKKTVKNLMSMLSKIDPSRAKDILNKNEQNNKVRLVRALEIAKALGKVPKITSVAPLYKFVKIGLYLPEKKLREKINKRLITRIKLGMIKEALKLRKNGLSLKRMKGLGLEYKYLALYLEKKISKQEMIEKLQIEIYQYAKRQITWFKRDKDIKWLDASKKINLKNL